MSNMYFETSETLPTRRGGVADATRTDMYENCSKDSGFENVSYLALRPFSDA